MGFMLFLGFLKQRLLFFFYFVAYIFSGSFLIGIILELLRN